MKKFGVYCTGVYGVPIVINEAYNMEPLKKSDYDKTVNNVIEGVRLMSIEKTIEYTMTKFNIK